MLGNELTEDDLKNMSPEEIAELQKQNCIFCKIANKEIPSKIIHEDSDTICVLDINPASEGHILVYPKKHYMIMPHIPEDVLAKIFKSVKLMSHTLLKTLQCGGTTIFIANGVAAGQKAPHVLIHVFPRRENDGLVPLPQYEMSDEQISKLSSQIGMYTGQVFGRKKHIVKDAEFTEKRSVNEKPVQQIPTSHIREAEIKSPIKIDRKDSEKDKDDNDEADDENSIDDGSGNDTEDDKPDRDKESRHPVKKEPKSNKVDLDDIARLFG